MKVRKENLVQKRSYNLRQLLLAVVSQTKAKNKHILALSSQQASQLINKGLLMLAVVSLWWWNWQLLLATSVGIILMWLSYKVSSKQWRKLGKKLIASLTQYNRKLFSAVVSGVTGGFVTYLTTAIWLDTENHWLATGSILQGLGTIATLILLSWYLLRHKSGGNHNKFEQLLADLTAENSLKRFIAIRQLTNLVHKKAVDREHHRQLIEYFHFMLLQPQDSAIQSALVDSLAILGISDLSDLNLPQSPGMAKAVNLKHPISENVF